MPKKTTPSTSSAAPKTKKSPAVAADVQAEAPVKETKARNSTVPPKAKTASKSAHFDATTTEVTDAMIAEHAYHMWKSGEPGDQDSHWHAAVKKLRGE